MGILGVAPKILGTYSFGLGLRGGLLGSTPIKNEVSGQFCLLVLSVLRLLRDVFVAMQSGVNCFDCRIASLGWALWLAGTDSQRELGERVISLAALI